MDYETLLTKGFTKQEAARAIEITNRAKQKNVIHHHLDVWVYWLLLGVAIIGNLLIAILLIPFLLAFKDAPLYITIITLAVSFGYIFDWLVREVEHINKSHILAGLFIPALATINIYFMVSFANFATTTLNLPFKIHSPIWISLVYVVAFTLPFIIHNSIDLRKKRTSPAHSPA